jgi:hypothetical protein
VAVLKHILKKRNLPAGCGGAHRKTFLLESTLNYKVNIRHFFDNVCYFEAKVLEEKLQWFWKVGVHVSNIALHFKRFLLSSAG